MTSMQKEQVSSRLKALRNKLGLSQAEMGRITGQGAFYGNIERGSDVFNEMAVVKIADALDCDEDWLLTGSGREPDYVEMRSTALLKLNEPNKMQSHVSAIPEPKPETRKPAPSSIPDPGLVGARDPEPEPEADRFPNRPNVEKVIIGLDKMEYKIVHHDGLQMNMIVHATSDIDTLIIQPNGYKEHHSLNEIGQIADMYCVAFEKAQEIIPNFKNGN